MGIDTHRYKTGGVLRKGNAQDGSEEGNKPDFMAKPLTLLTCANIQAHGRK